jgi:ABC-type dipeptide/oligopeptide/nickel transport system permease component
MRQFIVRRVLYSIVTLLILSATIFLIVRFTGDPVGTRPVVAHAIRDLHAERLQG